MTARTSSARRSKGSKGEREVVAMFRANGFPRAARSPGSGAMRSYGAGSPSPWPGDLCFVEPWLVEVKYAEASAVGGGRTWPGSSFIKGELRKLVAMWHHSHIIGGSVAYPVLFARANLEPWRVWIPTVVFASWGMVLKSMFPEDGPFFQWVEITPEFFFQEVVPRWMQDKS